MTDFPGSLNRRRFLQTTLFGATALAAISSPETTIAGPTKAEGDPFRGLKVGLTTYTLRKFSLEQAIAMTKQAGVKYVSIKEMHLPLKSTKEQRQAVREKVSAAGLILMGGGVIYMKNKEEEVRNDF
jgi:hypothetical protein